MDEKELFKNYVNQRLWNGTNHPLSLYSSFNNETEIAATRNGKHFIVGKIGEPLILRQQIPLSVRPYYYKNDNPNIITIHSKDKQQSIDVLHNYKNYDCIIVSAIYTACIKEILPENIDNTYNIDLADYMDRLFTPTALYNKNPEKFEDAEKIGAAYINRVAPVQETLYYRTLIQKGAQPSLFSVYQSLQNPLGSGICRHLAFPALTDYLMTGYNQISNHQTIGMQRLEHAS